MAICGSSPALCGPGEGKGRILHPQPPPVPRAQQAVSTRAADWLTASERELLEALNQDGDFALEATESDQEWMRLTHPHLSNEIYPHLLTGNPAHLCAGSCRRVREGVGYRARSAALRMLEAFAAGGEGALAARMHLVDSTLLGRLCVQAWQRYSPSSDSRMQAGCMLHGPAGATRRSQADPAELLRRALEYIETAETREPGAGAWPAWWLSPGECTSGTTRWRSGRGAVVDFGRTGAADLVAHLATAVLARRRGVSVGIGRGRSGLAGRSRGSWRLALRLAGPEGREVLARAVVVESSGLRVAAYRIASLGARLAGGVASDAGVGDAGRFAPPRHHVAGRARRQRQRIVDVRLAGIARTRRDLPAEQAVVALMAKGYDWLNGREDNESWTYVWRALLARKADLPAGQSTAALMARGCDWLNGRDDSESWAFVWQELLAREDDLPAGMTVVALMARGCDWLNTREDNESWTYVWRALLARKADLPAGQSTAALMARGVTG